MQVHAAAAAAKAVISATVCSGSNCRNECHRLSSFAWILVCPCVSDMACEPLPEVGASVISLDI